MNKFLKSLDIACKKVGSQAALAEKLNVSKGSVSQWKKAGKVPMKRCIEIERLTGISRRNLNHSINWDYYAS